MVTKSVLTITSSFSPDSLNYQLKGRAIVKGTLQTENKFQAGAPKTGKYVIVIFSELYSVISSVANFSTGFGLRTIKLRP